MRSGHLRKTFAAIAFVTLLLASLALAFYGRSFPLWQTHGGGAYHTLDSDPACGFVGVGAAG